MSLRQGRTRRPTIFDVARSADVSYSTVSRVVNGGRNVEASTRSRVEAAMLELGYVPHVNARALARGRTQAVGLLAQGVDNPFFSMLISSIDHSISTGDYDLLLCTTHRRREKETEYVARLSRGMVDGLLIVLPTRLPEYVAQLQEARFPFVLIDHDSPAAPCNVINAANRVGARSAIEHLVELGHRRIGFITGLDDVAASQERLGGYREALAAAGIAADEDLIAAGDFLEPRGHAAAHELLALDAPPSAIFASSDTAAFGVLRAARDLGLAVPRDLSVVGFDDILEATYVSPPLTTVRQPLREMGRLAVERLMSLIDDPFQAPTRAVLPTELVVRESTAPPRRRARGMNGRRARSVPRGVR